MDFFNSFRFVSIFCLFFLTLFFFLGITDFVIGIINYNEVSPLETNDSLEKLEQLWENEQFLGRVSTRYQLEELTMDIYSKEISLFQQNELQPNLKETNYEIMSEAEREEIYNFVFMVKNLMEELKDPSNAYCGSIKPATVWFEMSIVFLGFICLSMLLVCSIVTIRKVKTSGYFTGRQQLYKKTMATSLLLLGAFTICWIPYISFVVYMFFHYTFEMPLVSNVNLEK